jgi:hypothetical protein
LKQVVDVLVASFSGRFCRRLQDFLKHDDTKEEITKRHDFIALKFILFTDDTEVCSQLCKKIKLKLYS